MDAERRLLLKRLGVGGAIGIGTVGIGASVLGGQSDETDHGNGDGSDITSTEGTPESTTEPPDEPAVRHASEFGTVVEALDYGVDPEGTQPINQFLVEQAGDDTLLSFPAGTYRLDPVDLSGYTGLGIAASHDERPTFVGQEGNCIAGGNSHVLFQGVSDFLLDGIDFDFEAPGAGGAIRINAAGDVTISNIAASGGCADQIVLFRIDMLEPDATGLIENLNLDNRDQDVALTGVYVGDNHAGEVIFRDCTITGFTDNGLYASAPGLPDGKGGIVHVEGGTYRNNNIANVRLGSEGSTARGVTSISDAPPPTTPDSPPQNARGFRLRNGQGQAIENCQVRITADSKFTHGGIVFHETNGGAIVRDTTIEIDRDDTPAIRAFPLDSSHTETPVFENVSVTGNSATGDTIVLDGRDGTVLRNCTIEQTGADRNGVYFRDSADCRIVDSRIDVTRNPLVLRGSTVSIEDTTIVGPNGTEVIAEMQASDEDFTPRGEK